jgi:sulfur-carrier protein adenylyltransferase/sulfurtransferase
MRVCEQILDLARWAPSGDNTQPWRFEIRGDHDIVVHGFDTRDHVVYDLDGHPSQMALGALLETMRIAATGHGLRTEVSRRMDMPEHKPTFDVRLVPDASLQPSPLIPVITTRAVQRRPMSTKPLAAEQLSALEASVGVDYQVVSFQDTRERWEVAKLLFSNAKLRLTMREAFETHRSVIEWNARFSQDKIPEQAVGVDPVTAKLMRS